MERLLANICQESTKIQDIQSKCLELLDHLATDDGKQTCYSVENLCHILEIFQLCCKSEVNKLNSLGIDLIRTYIRKVNEISNDQFKEETINTVLKCCREMLSQIPVNSNSSLDLFSILVEIAATFCNQLTIHHIIDIIEICHCQIKEYVLAHKHTTLGRGSLPGKVNSLLPSLMLANLTANASATSSSRMSIAEDKTLSAIFLTGSQLCHHYTKNRVLVSSNVHSYSSTGSCSAHSSCSEPSANSRVSSNFVYLLLYLSKKLESKLSFYHDIKQQHSSKNEGSDTVVATTNETNNGNGVSSPEDSKNEMFVLLKIYNCFYLKCLQYTLLTIPDAWKYMNGHMMEIICKNLVPILVDILSPLSSLLVNHNHSERYRNIAGENDGGDNSVSSEANKLEMPKFGRGSEKVNFTSVTNKDFLFNTLNCQERQYIYKIALELLRLFGLENSMRPLLEALFHRIFLLPPLEQRLDSLIYMQEVLKNPLLVLILMSNPLCLFGASSSHSQNLDLFKIFIDAIHEASKGSALLVQLSSLCLITLFNTLDSLASYSTGSANHRVQELPIWRSPTVKMILNYVSTHRNLYESVSPHANKQKNQSSYFYAQLPKYTNRYNILSLKSRICGYDSKHFAHYERPHSSGTESSVNKSTSGVGRSYLADNTTELGCHYMANEFDYQNRLNALIGSQVSLSESAIENNTGDCENQSSHVSQRINKAPEHLDIFDMTALNSQQNRCLHLSLEHIDKHDMNTYDLELLSKTNLRYIVSDSKLYISESNTFTTRLERDFTCNSDISVFEPQGASETETELQSSRGPDSFGRDKEATSFAPSPNSMFSTLDLAGQETNLRHFERALSHIFIRKLNAFLPQLVENRNLLMVDEEIQTFASNYCKDLFKNLKQLNRSSTESTVEDNTDKPSLGDLEQNEIDILIRYSYLVDSLFINADGIYLATYAALLLSIKLISLGYYQSNDRKVVPLSESEFIDDIFDYHITIYLSPHFLAEIYQSILSKNYFAFLLENIEDNEVQNGANLSKFENVPLVKLLHDIDVVDSSKPNAFKLSDYVRLEQAMGSTETRQNVAMGDDPGSEMKMIRENFSPLRLLIKRLISYFWDTFSTCLKVGLERRFTYQNVVNVLDSVNGNYVSSLCLQMNCATKLQLAQMKSTNVYLQTIQVLLAIAVKVNAYNRLDTLYLLVNQYIAKYSLQERSERSQFINEIKGFSLKKSTTTPELSRVASGIANQTKTNNSNLGSGIDSSALTNERVHRMLSPTQVMSIKTLLVCSSQVASNCPRVWRHVFDLCKFVIQLENSIFRSCHSSLLSRARISISTILKSNSISASLSLASTPATNEEAGNDLCNSFSYLPGINELENLNLERNFESIINGLKEKNHDQELKSKELEQVVEYLSLFVSQIFENVALKCNLSLLSNFVRELCAYSRDQLEQLKKTLDNAQPGTQSVWVDQSSSEFKSLMLIRLVEVILRFVRNGRPLLHFMKIWPDASAHLVDASVHRELAISKKAITSMHDIINAALSAYSEPDFFNFNESLFKSYERLLLFELCNSDCQQELLLNSICEFVEGASGEIRSGWRSIFKALRGLRLVMRDDTLMINCTHHVQIIVDTFEAFLNTNNMHVFAYASVDFLLCLFHLIRSVSTISVDNVTLGNNLEETFIIFLKYVQKFCKVLRSIHTVPEDAFVIAPHIRAKKAKLIQLDNLRESLSKVLEDNSDYCIQSALQLHDDCQLDQVDKPAALLQLWCLVFDEFAISVYTSQLNYRPMLLEVFFTLVQTVADIDGSYKLVLHCLNHYTLPLMQNLLTETVNTSSSNGSATTNNIEEKYMFLKSWMEVFNNYIVRYLLVCLDNTNNIVCNQQCESNDTNDKPQSAGLLLKQSLLIYIECLSGNHHDLISILALSLIRQLLISLSRALTPLTWGLVIDCFRIGHQLTISPLKQLMTSFVNLPMNSDVNRIKIMTTRVDRSSECIRKRVRQIFFLDVKQILPKQIGSYIGQERTFHSAFHGSKSGSTTSTTTGDIDNRDYAIIVETSSGVNQSFSYSVLITQLHNHLVLLQMISTLLTLNLKPNLSDLLSFLQTEDFNTEMCTNANQETDGNSTLVKPVLGMTLTQYRELCTALKQSFSLAVEFDSRPRLKFLMQHICQTNISANLYRMSTLVWSVQFIVNFFLCCSESHRSEECSLALRELFTEIGSLFQKKVQLCQSTSKQYKQASKYAKTEQYIGTYHNMAQQKAVFPAGVTFKQQEIDKDTSQQCVPQQQSSYQTGKQHTNPFNEDTTVPNDGNRMYEVIDSRQYELLMNEYKRGKQKQNLSFTPAPQQQHTKAHENTLHDNNLEGTIAFGGNDSNNCEDHLALDMKTGEFMKFDSQVCVYIWSEILAHCVRLHTCTPVESFRYMLPHFLPLVRTLILHSGTVCSSNGTTSELNSLLDSLANWVERTVVQLMSSTIPNSNID